MNKKIYLILSTLIGSICLLLILVRIILSGYILNVQNYLDISEQFNLISIADEGIQQALDYEMGVENLPLSLVEDLVPREDIEFGFFERIENVIGYIKGDTLGIASYDPELYAWKFGVAFDNYLAQLPYPVSDSKVQEVISEVNSVIYNEVRANIHQIDFNFLQYSQSLQSVIGVVRFIDNPIVFVSIIVILFISLFGIYASVGYSIISSMYWSSIVVMINFIFFKVMNIYLQSYRLNFNLMRINELNDAVNSFIIGLFEYLNYLSSILFVATILIIIPKITIKIWELLKKYE